MAKTVYMDMPESLGELVTEHDHVVDTLDMPEEPKELAKHTFKLGIMAGLMYTQAKVLSSEDPATQLFKIFEELREIKEPYDAQVERILTEAVQH